jgi:hypothetical protein
LLGESGKSTIFKQFKILQDDTNNGFTQAELARYKTAVFANTITQMVILLMVFQTVIETHDNIAHI